jgi:dephospho-CoA kinase
MEGVFMSEIYFIGGSPCSGKSSIAKMLVEKYGFNSYKQDDYLEEYIKKGAGEGRELFQKVSRLSMEEMWMREPREQCLEEISLYETMLRYCLDDISKLPQDKPIVAEGAGFLPYLAKRLNIDTSHYICIVPTKEFQLSTYSKRPWISQYLAECPDQDRAFANWMARDALLAEKVLSDSKDLGYPYLIVDGAHDIHENCALVEEVFRLSSV